MVIWMEQQKTLFGVTKAQKHKDIYTPRKIWTGSNCCSSSTARVFLPTFGTDGSKIPKMKRKVSDIQKAPSRWCLSRLMIFAEGRQRLINTLGFMEILSTIRTKKHSLIQSQRQSRRDALEYVPIYHPSWNFYVLQPFFVISLDRLIKGYWSKFNLFWTSCL